MKGMFMEPIIGVPIFLVNRNSDCFCNENIAMSIGTRIRQARKSVGLTQKELAVKVGMNQSSLSELETGESTGTTIVATIANALGVNALWLEKGVGEMAGQPAPEAPQLADGWSELTRVDVTELRLLALFRRADARLKREILSSVEEYVRGAAIDSQVEPDPEQERRQRTTQSKTHQLGRVAKPASLKRHKPS